MNVIVLYAVALTFGTLAAVFMPFPVGIDRGKIKWNYWCATGKHFHTVYWHGTERGFQTIHPSEVTDK